MLSSLVNTKTENIIFSLISVQFSSLQTLSCVWLFATPWTAAHQASLSITNSRSLLKLMSIELLMPSNHQILCRPFSSCPQSFPASRSFSMSWLFASCGQSIRPSTSVPFSEYSGLISFRIDWFDLLLSKGLSRVFSSTIVQKYKFFGTQPSLWFNSHIHTWLLEKS